MVSLGHQSLTASREVGPPGAASGGGADGAGDEDGGFGGDGGLAGDGDSGADGGLGADEAAGGPGGMAVPLSAADIPASLPRSGCIRPAYAGGAWRR